MKNISLWLVIVVLLIVSCTADTIDTTESIDSKVSSKKSGKTARLVQNLTPENPANVYDFAGKLHNDILDIYLTGNYQYNTIAEIAQQIEAITIVNRDSVFSNLKTNQPINIEEIQEIVNNPESKLNEAIVNSSMTNVAKDSLSSFMNSLFLWENAAYEEIYESIISYEASVMANTQFTNEDKRIILTTSSIARYSIYYAKERKDKDWDSSVGNRVGGVSGAIDNSSTAVVMSLVAGIMINNLAAD
ncbi:hypothetical protein FNW52_16920 [Flavobacterium sp. ZT3R18]|uniref:hypothetical protein n=1 Tax=Flavobacterium sp. ZT3R18 TaxID=2594429 RepID=UPI00117A7211|nr:hypothetical protein [Flavobacterium sp. ZT3R18]TRX32568.1 hypothetical protein FNW52_16920 [Flavobacterium sp. ZT3R18]